jgi:uncharacterized peroxidase-related enzyme
LSKEQTMPYIEIDNAYPGIMSPAWYKPSTGKALFDLAQRIMRGPSPLTLGERELIAVYVSALNECEFCTDAHAAVCSVHLDQPTRREDVTTPEFVARQTPQMQALLALANQVRLGGRRVSAADADAARAAGASDEAIHDTVLIAAAFCMYNRYVDGLGIAPLAEAEQYRTIGERMARMGYLFPPRPLRWAMRWMLDRMFPVER